MRPDFQQLDIQELYIVCTRDGNTDTIAATDLNGRVVTQQEDFYLSDPWEPAVTHQITIPLTGVPYTLFRDADLGTVVKRMRENRFRAEEEAEIAAVRAKYKKKREL